MSWTTTGATAQTWTTADSVTSYGWAPLSAFSDPNLDIGVAFVLRAKDHHGLYAYDDWRGYGANDGPLGNPV